ncbi:MAG: hypothetical protein ACRBM6_17235 [Geminicoccales bacterium]
MDKVSRHVVSKLRRLEHDATPGPWAVYGNSIEDAKKIPLATLTKEHFDDKNAELITELRNAVPRLLHLIELQEKEISRLRDDKNGAQKQTAPKGSTVLQ